MRGEFCLRAILTGMHMNTENKECYRNIHNYLRIFELFVASNISDFVVDSMW